MFPGDFKTETLFSGDFKTETLFPGDFKTETLFPGDFKTETLFPGDFKTETLFPGDFKTETLFPGDFKTEILFPGDFKTETLFPGDFKTETLFPGDFKTETLFPGDFKTETLFPGDFKTEILFPGDFKTETLFPGDFHISSETFCEAERTDPHGLRQAIENDGRGHEGRQFVCSENHRFARVPARRLSNFTIYGKPLLEINLFTPGAPQQHDFRHFSPCFLNKIKNLIDYTQSIGPLCALALRYFVFFFNVSFKKSLSGCNACYCQLYLYVGLHRQKIKI